MKLLTQAQLEAVIEAASAKLPEYPTEQDEPLVVGIEKLKDNLQSREIHTARKRARRRAKRRQDGQQRVQSSVEERRA